MRFPYCIILLALAGLFQSCKFDKFAVDIIPQAKEISPVPGEPLTFSFSQNILSDSILIGMENPDLINIEPELPGRTRFTSLNTIEFLPIRPPVPGQNYTFSMTEAMLDNVPDYHLGQQFSAIIPASPLTLEKCNPVWEESGALNPGQSHLKIQLTFNYPVRTSEVAKYVAAEFNSGETLNPIWGEDLTGKTVFFILETGGAANFNLAVKINPGLSALSGGLPTQDLIYQKCLINDSKVLQVNTIAAEHNGVQGRYSISLNQKVEEEGLKDFISLNPAVPFTASVVGQDILVESTDFEPGSTYEITLKAGLVGNGGGRLPSEFTEGIHFKDLDPTIRFTENQGTILSKNGLKNLKVNIWGCKTVTATLKKVYENNLLPTIGQGYTNYYEDDLYSQDYTHNYHYYNALELTDEIWTKTYDVKKMPASGAARVLTLDLPNDNRLYKGLYLLTISSPDAYWEDANKLINLTDIGLIAKKSDREILVFANSIREATVLPGIKVTFTGKNNQEVATSITNAEGVAVYKIDQGLAEGFNVQLITASNQHDFSYLELGDHEVNTSRFDVEGVQPSGVGLEGMIYGERNIYRPGETVNLATIVRTSARNAPGVIPVIVELRTPDYKKYKTIRKNLNAAGAADVAIDIPVSAPTGTWTASVYSSNEVLLGSTEIKIEEFMPDRLKSTLKLDKEVYHLGDTIINSLEASSFFGPPAAGRSYESILYLEEAGLYPQKYSSYTFSSSYDYRYIQDDIRTGILDSLGKATELFSPSATFMGMGVLNGTVRSTVYDETGRPVHRRKNFVLHTQSIYFGIGPTEYAQATGKPVTVSLIALNPDEQPIATDAEVRVVREEYETSLSSSSSFIRYDSRKVLKEVSSKVIPLAPRGTPFSFTPEVSGKYIIEVREPGANWHTSRSIWVYGLGQTTYTSYKVNRDGNIDLTADKKTYKVGETAKILLKGPFSGKMLITVEGNEVLRHFYVQTDKRAAWVNIPITGEMAPNVYITATLIKPHKETDMPLTVAHGVIPLFVENPATHIPLEIASAESSPSQTRQTIRIKTAPFASVTIAAVDEGILQVGKMKTPDPHAEFYKRIGLNVGWFDHYRYLLPEVKGGKSSTGGDGYGLENRLNPLANRRVKLVSFWSGVLQADAAGNISFPIQIPQFSGSIRIMAVAHKGAAFAHAESQMRVADPLVISTALPRFLSPGDTLEMPVFVSNTEKKPVNATVSLKLDGPLKIVSAPPSGIEIAPNREARLNYRITALREIGEAAVTVSVEGFGKTFRDKTEITVRPTAPLQKRNGNGSAKGGETAQIKMDHADFLPKTIRKKLVVSRSPMVEFSKNLEDVVRYPHGCVEQTVSAVFPQLYFADLMQAMYQSSTYDSDPDFNIKTAIRKLMLMQRYDGGLTYWPTSAEESWWGSTWAAHFLLEAQKAGYEVDPEFLNSLLQYLRNKVAEKSLEDWKYDGKYPRRSAPREVPYSLFVLALAEQPDISMMNYYKSRPALLRSEGQYLLAAAFVLVQGKDQAAKLLPAKIDPKEYLSPSSNTFSSEVRDLALALYLLIEVDPNNPKIPEMAQLVSKNLHTQSYLSTQENAFGLLAMGKLARRNGQSTVKAEVWSGDKKVGTFDGKKLALTDQALDLESITLKTTGTGSVYWFWETEGVSAKGDFKETDQYMKVRRTYYKASGGKIQNGIFRQNDLVVVKITASSLFNQPIKYVAVTDMLPACFEIENPRLVDLAPFKWIGSQDYPDYMDIRDDRINFFTDLPSKDEREFYYMVRVVSQGKFAAGPVGADAMYDGSNHSYHGSGLFTVLPRMTAKEAETICN